MDSEGYTEVLCVTSEETSQEWVTRVAPSICVDKIIGFSRTNNVKGRTILLGNNKAFKIVAIWSIKLKLADDTKRVSIDVRHVPESKES